MFPYPTTAYSTYFFSENRKNGLLSLGFRDNTSTTSQLSLYPEQYHCSFVLHGTGTYFYNDQQFPLVVNTVYQRFPSDSSNSFLIVSDDWMEYHICISASIFDALSDMNILHTDVSAFEVVPEPYLYKWMYDQVTNPVTNNSDDVFEQFFNAQKLLRAIHKTNIHFHYHNEKEQFQAALPMLSSNFKDSVSFEEIAKSFGLSYETFRKKFKEYIGMSPLQFRLTSKFYFARRLLADGYSIAQVAEETGYADPFIFSRQFKKYTGKSPKEFKM